MTRKRTFGTHEIARICQVTPPTISRWLTGGKLPFYKTAGGHRRVWDVDLVSFLNAHNMPVPPDLQGAGALRVLVVDDEPGIRRFVLDVVRELYPDAETHEAGDGFEAGHKIATLQPEIVVLDLRLPGVDGFNICRTVRGDPRLKDVKILAITGMGVEESRLEILRAGADGFLAKPFVAEDLSSSLRRLVSARSPSGDR